MEAPAWKRSPLGLSNRGDLQAAGYGVLGFQLHNNGCDPAKQPYGPTCASGREKKNFARYPNI